MKSGRNDTKHFIIITIFLDFNEYGHITFCTFPAPALHLVCESYRPSGEVPRAPFNWQSMVRGIAPFLLVAFAAIVLKRRILIRI